MTAADCLIIAVLGARFPLRTAIHPLGIQGSLQILQFLFQEKLVSSIISPKFLSNSVCLNATYLSIPRYSWESASFVQVLHIPSPEGFKSTITGISFDRASNESISVGYPFVPQSLLDE